jgi:hypothetical protein
MFQQSIVGELIILKAMPGVFKMDNMSTPRMQKIGLAKADIE